MGCSCSSNGENVALVAEDIRETYALSNELLGRGSFGQVRTAVQLKTGLVCAVKIIQRDNKVGEWSNEAMFKTEVELIRSLDHTNLIKFYEVYEDPRFLYVVMEKCDGGEVFDKIRELRRFGEWDASNIGRQMLLGLQYIHGLNIVHRDVKAENFLFHTKDISSPLRLIDFGMAKRKVENEYFTSLCGSPHYLSPELIGQRYNESTDLWSFGVLMYLMLYGRYPFDGSSPEEIMRNILSGEVNWKHNHVHLSSVAVQFLRRFLVLDVTKRITAKQALTHDWICSRKPDVKALSLPQEVRAAAHSASKIRFNQNVISTVQDFQQKLSEAEKDYSRGIVGVRIVGADEKHRQRNWSMAVPNTSRSIRRCTVDQAAEGKLGLKDKVENTAPLYHQRHMSLPIGRRLSNLITGRNKVAIKVVPFQPVAPVSTPQSSVRGVSGISDSTRIQSSGHASIRSHFASSPSAVSSIHSTTPLAHTQIFPDSSTCSIQIKSPSGDEAMMRQCNVPAPPSSPMPGEQPQPIYNVPAPPSSPMPGEQPQPMFNVPAPPSSPMPGEQPQPMFFNCAQAPGLETLEERLKAKFDRPVSPNLRDFDDTLSVDSDSSRVGAISGPVPAVPSAAQVRGREWLADTPAVIEEEVQSGYSSNWDGPPAEFMVTAMKSEDSSLQRSPTVGPSAPSTLEECVYPCETPVMARGCSAQTLDEKRLDPKSTVRRLSLAIQHMFSSNDGHGVHTRLPSKSDKLGHGRPKSHLTEYMGGISENEIQEFAAEYARKTSYFTPV